MQLSGDDEYTLSLSDEQTGGGSSWTDYIPDVLKTWGSIELAKQQAEVAETNAKYRYYPTSLTQQYPGGTVTYPSYSTYGVQKYPIASAAQSDDFMYMLIAAGIVGAAFLLRGK